MTQVINLGDWKHDKIISSNQEGRGKGLEGGKEMFGVFNNRIGQTGK